MKIVIMISRIPINENQTKYEIGLTYESSVVPMNNDYITIDDLHFIVKSRKHVLKDGKVEEIQCFCIAC